MGMVGMQAHAWVINVGGTYTGTFLGGFSLSQTWQNSTLFPGTFGHGVLFTLINSTNHAGQETFSDGVRTLELNFTGTHIELNGTHALSGTWNATNIQNLAILDAGTYTFVFDGAGNWSHSVVGAVPEPATVAALGLGGVALAARRRRRR
jgi:hypothetical protein